MRPAAAALRSSKSALGSHFRRWCSRTDKPKAAIAAPYQHARLIYTMLTQCQKHTDQGQDHYGQHYREPALRAPSRRAAKPGLKMVPAEQPA